MRNNKRGETVLESVIALTVVTLSVTALLTAVLTSMRIMELIGLREQRYEEAVRSVEMAEELRKGTVIITSENGETESIDVIITGKDGGISGYIPYEENEP